MFFVQVDDMIVMETVCLQIVDVYYCSMCSTDCDYMSLIKYLCATWCGSVPLDSSCVLLWIDTVVFY